MRTKRGREQQVLTEAPRAINRPIEPKPEANRNSDDGEQAKQHNAKPRKRTIVRRHKASKERGSGDDEDSDRNSKPGIEAGQVNSLFRDGVRQTNPTD